MHAVELLTPFRIASLAVERVWGGARLGRAVQPIGEYWGAFEGNQILDGPLRGMTLAEASRRYPAQLLGASVAARSGPRFPILTKLLDTSAWLSVQLHPNDEQARQLAGAGQLGKTEAWHLLDTAPDAEIILGLQPGIDRERFAAAVRAGKTLEVIARQPANSGDTWFIPAGTVHALGPGILLYEVQQASDITYRVYDWDRPASAARALHLDEAMACIEPAPPVCRVASADTTTQPARLVSCPYFALDRLALEPGGRVQLDTGGATFHALTAVAGAARLEAAGVAHEIPSFATVLIPAAAGRYVAASEGGATLMIASS